MNFIAVREAIGTCQVIETFLVENYKHEQEQETKILSSHRNLWFWILKPEAK